MCGIAGYYSPDGDIRPEVLKAMSGVMPYRGPDSEGFFFDQFAGLAHRRLSIIDLSEQANQPMHSASDRYIMVYNGEVYNFKEVARETGIVCKTQSDSEVLIECFAKKGPDFVNRLNGMFALAIYDREEKKLTLLRDRMGIKPLFYFWDGKNFAFASELKALLQIPIICKNQDIDNEAVQLFLHLGYIPEPFTIYKNIRKFPSGSFLNLQDNKLEINSYWKLAERIGNYRFTKYEEARDYLKDLLRSSIRYRLISDVPYGTFLSGGVDSSLVTAIACEVDNNPIKTFSIGFTDNRFNEATYARRVAEHLHTDHHEFFVTYRDALDLIPSLGKMYDEPYADSSAIPTFLVAKMAKKHVTMTLSGDGGDELFMGYGAYTWAKRLNYPLVPFYRHSASWLLNLHNNRSQRASRVFSYPQKKNLKSHIFSQEQYFFSEKETCLLTGTKTFAIDHLNIPPSTLRTLNSMESQALFDMQYYLKDDLLVKVDRATMQNSLETRVPLLDYRIIEFSLNLPAQFKMANGKAKYILKDILSQYVPENLFNRPKQGFAIPLSKWMKNELRPFCETYLNENLIKESQFVDYNQVAKLKHQFFNKHKDFLFNRLWLLVVLHQWKDNKSS